MSKVGAVRKGRTLTRICVVLGVILLFSSIGITLTAAAPNENAPGQDQCNEGHGNTDKECVPDPSQNGHDCEAHGNGGVNENHCESESGTTGSTGGTTTGEGTGTTTGEGTGNATGNSTGEGTGNSTGEGTGNSTGEGTGNATGNATGNSTGEGTGNATGNSTGNATGNSTGNATGNSTGNSTGESTTGGTENGTTTGAPVVDGNNLDDEVLGRTVERAALATTGGETKALALIGSALLLIGGMMRFGRFGTRVAAATASPADAMVARSLAVVERAVRSGSRDWNCRG